MTETEFSNLSSSDIVRHKEDHRAYIVSSNNGKTVTLVHTVEATNPIEWKLVYKAKLTRPEDFTRKKTEDTIENTIETEDLIAYLYGVLPMTEKVGKKFDILVGKLRAIKK